MVCTGGLRKQLLPILNSRWQTAALLRCQVVIAPDAANRVALRQRDGGRFKRKRNLTDETWLVSATLSSMFLTGQVERRKNSQGRFEYRTPQPEQSGLSAFETMKSEGYEDAISLEERLRLSERLHIKINTVTVYLCRLRKVNKRQ